MLGRDYPAAPKALVGLTGKAGAGKSTLAHQLRATSKSRIIGFADPVKGMLDTMMGYIGEEIDWEDRDTKEAPLFILPGYPSPRRLAQTLGTDWGRELIHKDLWLQLGEIRIRKLWEQGFDVIVGDVRFDNEASIIRSLGGIVLKVDRDVNAVSSHPSEDGVSSHLIDAVIANDGSPADMFDNACKALFKIYNSKVEELYQ